MTKDIVLIFSFVGLVTFSFIIGFLTSVLYFENEDKLNNKSDFQNSTFLNCSNLLSLEDSVSCAVSEVSKFYNYTVTGDAQYKTEEDLKKYGGDCLDWSRYYQSKFYELNRQGGDFTPYVFTIRINSTTNHAFNVISKDNGGWCIINSNKYVCMG